MAILDFEFKILEFGIASLQDFLIGISINFDFIFLRL